LQKYKAKDKDVIAQN